MERVTGKVAGCFSLRRLQGILRYVAYATAYLLALFYQKGLVLIELLFRHSFDLYLSG